MPRDGARRTDSRSTFATCSLAGDDEWKPVGVSLTPQLGITHRCSQHLHRTVRMGIMYAAIRQGRAKSGMAEELARRIKDGAIPIISDVSGFRAYYVIYAPDDTLTAISIFDDHAGAAESNRRGLAW